MDNSDLKNKLDYIRQAGELHGYMRGFIESIKKKGQKKLSGT